MTRLRGRYPSGADKIRQSPVVQSPWPDSAPGLLSEQPAGRVVAEFVTDRFRASSEMVARIRAEGLSDDDAEKASDPYIRYSFPANRAYVWKMTGTFPPPGCAGWSSDPKPYVL